MKKIILFISKRDPDLRIFFQVFTMCLCNFIGLILWLIVRLPCSLLIVLAPGIMVAVVFSENKIINKINLVLLTTFVIIIFQVGVIMLQKEKIMLLFWVFFITYYMFSSAKLRLVSSYALLPCVTAFTMPLGFMSAVDITIEMVMSGVFTIIVLLIINEIIAKIRIKKIILQYASEVHDYFMYKTNVESKDCFTDQNMENLRLFSLNAISLVNKQEYLMKSNLLYSKNASTLLLSLHNLSRSSHFLKNVRKNPDYDKLIAYFDNLFEKLVNDLKSSKKIELIISNTVIAECAMNDDTTLNGFLNQYALTGMMNDFRNINGLNLEPRKKL